MSVPGRLHLAGLVLTSDTCINTKAASLSRSFGVIYGTQGKRISICSLGNRLKRMYTISCCQFGAPMAPASDYLKKLGTNSRKPKSIMVFPSFIYLCATVFQNDSSLAALWHLFLTWLDLSSPEEGIQGKAMSAGQVSRDSVLLLVDETNLCTVCTASLSLILSGLCWSPFFRGATGAMWSQNCQDVPTVQARVPARAHASRALASLNVIEGRCIQLSHDWGGREANPIPPLL